MDPGVAQGRQGGAPVGPSGKVAGPGPDQMYDLSLQQYRRGSLGTARLGFREFLRVYPTHDRVGGIMENGYFHVDDRREFTSFIDRR